MGRLKQLLCRHKKHGYVKRAPFRGEKQTIVFKICKNCRKIIGHELIDNKDLKQLQQEEEQ